MAINELIASGGTPVTINNPIKNALAISQMRGEDIKSDEAERAIRNRNSLNALIMQQRSGAVAPSGDIASNVAVTPPNYEVMQGYQKYQADQNAAMAERVKQRQAVRDQTLLFTAKTPDDLMKWHNANTSDVELTHLLVQSGVDPGMGAERIGKIQTPAQMDEFKAGSSLHSEKFFNHIVDQAKVANGAITADAAKTNAATSQGRLSVDQARAAEEKRWHDMQDANQDALVGTKTGKVAHVVTNNAGDVVQLDAQGNQVGETLKGAGKPSATFEKTVATNKKLKTDIDSTITELEGLVKKDGLLDKATGSGIGAGMDWTSNLVGHATEGAIALGAIAPIYDKVLKMVPRFEGPQSDRDTASYNKAAGDLANPNIPNEIKKSSATTILRLMRERKNQFGLKDDPTVHSGDKGAPPPANSGWGEATVEGGK